jgi:hypothetical protein
MDLRELDRLNPAAIKEFMSLKGLVRNEQNHAETIEQAEKDFDYIGRQLALDNPNAEKVMEKVDFLCSVVGIQSYMDRYKEIIFDHLQAVGG